MLNPLKFSGKETDFFFLSDAHYNHAPKWPVPIWKMRGFNSPEEYNAGIINNWNQECNFESIIFHLGDLIFNDGDGSKIIKLIDQLNFKELYLGWGNHNSGQKTIYNKVLKEQFPQITNQEVYPLKWQFNSIKTIYFMPTYFEIFINGMGFVLCHYPIISFNGQKDNYYHLSGHVHNNLPLTNPLTGKGRRLDVGFESFKKPVSLKFIKQFLSKRDIDSVDHHSAPQNP